MRLTNDYGESTRYPAHSRLVTNDGRLLWIGPVMDHQVHEFFLDGVNLGSITLDQAMEQYQIMTRKK